MLCCMQSFFKYYSSKAEADKKKHDDGNPAENYLHLYWTVFKKVCRVLWLLHLEVVLMHSMVWICFVRCEY